MAFILGIETSCDDTGLAIYDTSKNILITNILKNQIKSHYIYGGIVPEIAFKEHLHTIYKLFLISLNTGNIFIIDIDLISYTVEPGLIKPLSVGIIFAKIISKIYSIPLLQYNHLESHLFSSHIINNKLINFSFFFLLISGGHTNILKYCGFKKYKKFMVKSINPLGSLFDRIATFFFLPYPGGPYIEKLSYFSKNYLKNSKILSYKKYLNFSNIRTVFYSQKHIFNYNYYQLCCCLSLLILNKSILIVLNIFFKIFYTINNFKIIIIIGGVSSNILLRSIFSYLAITNDFLIFYSPLCLSTDNGAMVALNCYFSYSSFSTIDSFFYYSNPYIFFL